MHARSSDAAPSYLIASQSTQEEGNTGYSRCEQAGMSGAQSCAPHAVCSRLLTSTKPKLLIVGDSDQFCSPQYYEALAEQAC